MVAKQNSRDYAAFLRRVPCLRHAVGGHTERIRGESYFPRIP